MGLLVAANPAPAGLVLLSNTTDYEWWWGCSPTAAGMIMGHYDRNGYGSDPLHNQYPNLVPGGVAESSSYGVGVGPLAKAAIASAGHTNDFYKTPPGYQGSGDDNPTPWHGFNCLADFMGTSQDSVGIPGNANGSSFFDSFASGARYYVKDVVALGNTNKDAMFGIYEYVNYAGYGSGDPGNDTNFYTQHIKDPSHPLGCMFADYKAEIDAGRPVIIQIAEHSMFGYGYNTTGQIVYVHDTWTLGGGTMTWGGTYGPQNQPHLGMTAVLLTNGVPEPASVVLLVLVSAALALRRWKRVF